MDTLRMQTLYLYLCRSFWKHIKGIRATNAVVTGEKGKQKKKKEMSRTWRVLAGGTSKGNTHYSELL